MDGDTAPDTELLFPVLAAQMFFYAATFANPCLPYAVTGRTRGIDEPLPSLAPARICTRTEATRANTTTGSDDIPSTSLVQLMDSRKRSPILAYTP